MITAILSFLGLLVGATLQFLFTRHLENKKHHRELRAKAYSDYLQCVSEHANLGYQRNSEKGRQLGARTADAKCRISLYAAPEVITSFAKFERLGATMNSKEQRSAFTQMVALMRQDTLGTAKIIQSDLEVVLLGFD